MRAKFKIKPHRRFRMSRFPWKLVESDFVVRGLTKEQLIEKYGMSKASLANRVGAEQWGQKREEEQRKQAAQLSALTREEILRTREQSIRVVYGMKMRIAKRLNDLLDNDKHYRPTPKDYELLQRLESDLRDPGWSKAPGDGQQGGVNVQVMQVENLLMQLQADRGKPKVLDAGISPTISAFLTGVNRWRRRQPRSEA